MRFSKRVKVFPGFALNFSKSGVSGTLGVKGASINFSKKGTYINTGISGTGINNKKKLSGGINSSTPVPKNDSYTNEDSQVLLGEIKSAESEQLTSTSLMELKESLLEVYNDRIELTGEIVKTKRLIKSAKNAYVFSCIFLIGLFIKSFKRKVKERKEYLLDIEEQLKNSFINIDIHFDKDFDEQYQKVVTQYQNLLTTDVIWDITSAVQQDMKATRSSASTVVTRTPVKFDFGSMDIIKSKYSAFHFENRNGGDIYIYPGFVVVSSAQKKFGLIDIKDLILAYYQQGFLEEGKIPKDAVVLEKTWAKVNKNGTPDKRFKGNYQIPVMGYGKLEVLSASGLNECYSFSSYNKLDCFVKAFTDYQKSIL